ncbi:MAG: glycosyltransferase family 2 protein [Alphaproteobacteria bacterium]
MTRNLISIVSAVYNKADWLPATLARCQGLDVPNGWDVEFIFADDGSTDHSVSLLRDAAQLDPRIQIIANAENRGPAVRINQAAAAAKGRYILPMDADDLLPQNALTFLLKVATENDMPLVFGKSRRASDAPPIPVEAQIIQTDQPLAFCARRQIVHMGFLVAAEIWRAAGGADEKVFIQDQSLPLRLAAKADRLAYVEAVIYWLTPQEGTNLSTNVMQQHHDRFFSCLPLYRDPAIDAAARSALGRQMVSAVWKARRDAGKPFPHVSSAFMAYLRNRLFKSLPSDRFLAEVEQAFLDLPNVRRIEVML